MKRLLYLGYYLKKLDTQQFWLFFNHIKQQNGISSFSLIADVIGSSLKYNISLLEYFQFHFYTLNKEERKTYAGTGYMYEYQLVMNPKSSRQILNNKIEFFVKYKSFVQHITAGIETLKFDSDQITELLNNPSRKIVLKNSHGQCGWQVKIFETRFFHDKNLLTYMEKEKFDLAEEFIVQHSDLMSLSPSAVNTVRVISQLNSNNEVVFLGARLRISEDSPVDNMASGNFAASVDIDTGKVNSPGVYSDITKKDVTVHPISGIPVVGFQIPFWPEIINMVKEAALLVPTNRSIGWDIAVTKIGPELIEGNHDWCKLVWQLPVKKGLKKELDYHLAEYQAMLTTGQKNE